mgnify:FL=1|jgi:hypothetical protein
MNRQSHRWALALALAAALVGPVVAQTSTPSQADTTPNTTVHLIRLLVEQGVITAQQAQALMEQARREAVAAEQQAEPEVREGDVRVPYIPETVRDEIRAEVKDEVMAQAKEENWAAPNTFPDWVSRITLFGDVRVRNESRFYSGDNSVEIFDFNQFNDENYDLQELTPPPLLNTRESRENRLRVRARFGLQAALTDTWSAGLRVATGSSDSPVSTNQTLGGGLSKKDIWLDRAQITWAPGVWRFTAGRAENPFVSSDLLYDGDLNFDGVSASWGDVTFSENGAFFGTLGAFPLSYTSDDFPSREFDKKGSDDQWLLGTQIGADWRFSEDNRFLVALSYYDFHDIRGQRSSECVLYFGSETCDTDDSAPAFMQKGNTVFLLRDIALNPTDPANTSMPQLVGLASEFELFDLNLRWDTPFIGGYKLRLAGNYIYNHGYSEEEMFRNADGQVLNNFDQNGELKSGRDAWMVHAAFGPSLDLDRAGDWKVFVGYKHIKPDALPDAFNDSDFHLGGTNAKGYYLGGAYAFTDGVFAQGRWLSTDEVYGPPLAIDVLQIELNARF